MSLLSPSVSLLIRTKNRATSLKEALESIASQNFRPIEVVVVNDGGEDVESVVTECLSNRDIEWQYHTTPKPGKGRSHAANTAMSLAKGDFWLFLDDDDLILPDHLSSLVSQLKMTPDKVVGVYSSVQCQVKQVDSDVELKGDVFAFEFDATRLAFKNYLPIHAVLFSSKIYEKGCRFDESLDLYEDWHFWVQAIRFGDFEHLNKITALYRTHLSGIGAPGTEKNFNDELSLFFKAAVPFWQEKHWLYLHTQENHYFKLLSAYQALEDEKKARALQIQLLLENSSQMLQSEFATLSDRLNESNRLHHATQERLDKLESVMMHAYPKTKHQLTHHKTLRKTALFKTTISAKVASLNHKLLRLGHFSKVFARLLLQGDFQTLQFKTRKKFRDWFGRNRSQRTPTPQNSTLPSLDLDSPVFILGTTHTRFIALLIENGLKELGFVNVTILPPDQTTFTSDYHFVICPQMFEVLPSYYFAFQMEQSVSSRWFNDDYFNTLEHSIAIMDYSLKNIAFLQDEGHFPYQRLFYTPVSNLSKEIVFSDASAKNVDVEYDVVFYGDANAPRRKMFLDEIGKRFKLLVVSEVFGDALYHELSRAKVVVNIHYYENALLETTRVYECLSLGLNVVSESSSDQDEHKVLDGLVTFTPINDVEAMCQAIASALTQTEMPKPILSPDINHFTYYLGRMLLALDLISRDTALPAPLSCEQLGQRVGLSLPETYDRRIYLQESQPDTPIFPGLRHSKGWIGCALSYQSMAKQALTCGLTQLEACEDDVILGDQFENQLDIVHSFLFKKLGNENWDIFSGLIADLNEKTTVSEVYEYKGMQFAELNFMTSTVFNIYNQRALELLAAWDPYDENDQTNTIDRYLETKGMRVIVSVPFLVGHHEEQNSTLWGITNDVYASMIEKSEQRLRDKVSAYLSVNPVTTFHDDETKV